MNTNNPAGGMPASSLKSRHDRQRREQQCLEFLRMLHDPDAVFEVRALAVDSNEHRSDSGYFDDFMKAAKAVIALDEYSPPRGIYATLNPINSALLARSKNRLKDRAKTMSSDSDVVSRRWLFVDLDPERPSGISATDAEREAAIERANAVREWMMSEFGFGEPIESDSGNGRYLLWPIDLPNDDTSRELVSDVLNAISQHCGTDAVKIDTKVSNASRILRLPGTTNRKGDSTDDRPHRVAQLVYLPDYLRPEHVAEHGREVVSCEKLEAVAALLKSDSIRTAQTSAARPSCGTHSTSRTDIIERARKYVATIPGAVSGQGGHSATLVAAEHLVRGFELSDDEALALLQEWNQHCSPPWSEHELRHKITEARDKGTAVEWGQHLRNDSRTKLKTSPKLLTRCVADVPAQELKWLWPGFFPLGKLSLLAGDPGLGKGFVTCDIAARVSTGKPWPDLITDSQPVGSVVFLACEDDVADTIRPRLEAAGADLRRIHIVDSVAIGMKQKGFALDADLPLLRDKLAELRDVRLLVIDPITAYCGETDTHKNAEVRAMLQPLCDLAAEFQFAAAAVNHLSKAVGGKAVYRSTGSIAFAAAARAVWNFSKAVDDEAKRLMLPAKLNLAPDAYGMSYRISDGVVEWGNEPIFMSADQAEAQHDNRGEPVVDRNAAKKWLEAELSNGPVPSKQILDDGREMGFGEKALRKALDAIGGKARKDGFSRGWVWEIPNLVAMMAHVEPP